MKFWCSMILILLSQWAMAQTNIDYKKYFPLEVIEALSPKKYIKNYTSIEADFYTLTNLARMYPKEFEQLLDDYVKDSDEYHPRNHYVLSLKRDLKIHKPTQAVLIQHATLDQLALSHAQYGVKTKKVGHQNIDQRVKVVTQKMKHQSFSENCAYNYDSALDLFMALLIDEGIMNVGHRKAILNTKNTYMGIAILPYFSAGSYMVVQNFSSK